MPGRLVQNEAATRVGHPGRRRPLQAKPRNDYKRAFDLFLCGGTWHMRLLKPLLEKLRPYGKVHLASSFLSDDDVRALRGLYDVLHEPRHRPDGYGNFNLFCIRDIPRLATAPWFVKLDADVHLEPDWIDYVEESIAAHADAVLFGPARGHRDINVELTGALVRQVLGRDIRVAGAPKVIGGFYVGRTAFFREHAAFSAVVHEFLSCFKDGVRHRPSPNPAYWPAGSEAAAPIAVTGDVRKFQREDSEDTLRSLVAHAAGGSHRIHVLDSRGRVRPLRL